VDAISIKIVRKNQTVDPAASKGYSTVTVYPSYVQPADQANVLCDPVCVFIVVSVPLHHVCTACWEISICPLTPWWKYFY